MSTRIRILRRVGAAVPLIVLLVAAVLLARGASDTGDEHRMTVTLKDATNVVPGQYIRAAGQIVGSVGSVTPLDRGRAVRLELRFRESVWPVRRGARLRLRWGGTVSYNNRYLAYTPGPDRARAYRTGAPFRTEDVAVPVEFDQLLATFDGRMRQDSARFLRNAGAALGATEGPLRDALKGAPGALEQTSAVFRDVEANRAELRTLVRSADRVVGSVHDADPGLGQLVTATSATLGVLRRDAGGVRDTIERLPGTMRRLRGTLSRADATLGAASTVAKRVGPGVTELRRIAAPLDRTLGTLEDLGPDARTTLRTLTASTPDVDRLVGKVRTLAPTLRSIGDQADRQLSCIRPYTPELVAFFSNWADFFSWSDHKDRYLRANIQNILPAAGNAATGTVGDAQKQFPGLRYAFPSPPGYLAGQPWYLPECNITKDSLDADKDPEGIR